MARLSLLPLEGSSTRLKVDLLRLVGALMGAIKVVVIGVDARPRKRLLNAGRKQERGDPASLRQTALELVNGAEAELRVQCNQAATEALN